MKRLFLLVLIFCYPVTLIAQGIDIVESALFSGNGLIPNISDIRSAGMGKTGVAGTKNSNALFTNPSLLGALENISIIGAARCQFGMINDDKMIDSVNQINSIPNMSFQYDNANFPPYFSLNGLGFGIPLRIEKSKIPVTIGIALGYRPSYDYGSSSTVEYKIQNDTSVVQEKGKIVTKNRGGHRTLSAGFGVGINDRFFIGTSVNFCVAPNQTQKSEKNIETNQGESNESEISEYKGKGVYATIGMAVKPVPTFSIGMRVSPYLNMTFSDYSFERIVDNETIEEIEDVKEYDVKYPVLFTTGIEWQIIPRLAIAAEFQTRTYSFIEIELEELKMDNGYCFRAGSELLAGIVLARLGFSIETVTDADEKVIVTSGNPQIVKDDKPNLVFGPTLGVSVPIGENVVIDFAGGYDFLRKERKGFSPLDTGIISYEADAHNFQVDLGVTINFDGIVFGNAKRAVKPVPAPKQAPKPPTAPQPQEPARKIEEPVVQEQEPAFEADPLPPEPVSKVGSQVTITTDDGKTVYGVLVRETDTVYEIDSSGEKITIYKGIVTSIE